MNKMSGCVVCQKVFNSLSKPQKCQKCNNLVHKSICSTASVQNIGGDQREIYHCKTCVRPGSEVKAATVSVNPNMTDMQRILEEIRNMRSGVDQKLSSMDSKIDGLINKMDSFEKKESRL